MNDRKIDACKPVKNPRRGRSGRWMIALVVGLAGLGAPASGQLTQRVSEPTAGGDAPYPSLRPSLSGDGRLVAFDCTDLVAFPAQIVDIYVRDTWTGVTTQVTAGADGSSTGPRLSADGQWITFYSGAWNLDPADTMNQLDVFVSDMAGSFELVSKSSAGVQANLYSRYPDISGDGRHVVYVSPATNLTGDVDSNSTFDVFVHDRDPDANGLFEGNGTTTLISRSVAGGTGNGSSDFPAISANGRHVAFQSFASNLVAGDTNGALDVFVHDRDPDGNGILDEANGAITRVSVSSTGVEANNSCSGATLTGDGRYVAFSSFATTLDPADVVAASDVFLHDRDPDGNGLYDEGNGTTSIVSLDSLGNQTGGNATVPRLSADGTRIAFTVQGPLVWNDPNHHDVYVRDLVAGQTALASMDSAGNFANNSSGLGSAIAISADGSYVAFESNATNLIASDGNGWQDVFHHEVCLGSATELGYAKVGSNGQVPAFSLCGQLVGGSAAEFRLRQAPALQPAYLALALAPNPTPMWGGTVVPLPFSTLFGLSTSAAGEVTLGGAGGGLGPIDIYMQWLIIDPGASHGIGISNALKVTVLP